LKDDPRDEARRDSIPERHSDIKENIGESEIEESL
jgi:hypothetical protein